VHRRIRGMRSGYRRRRVHRESAVSGVVASQIRRKRG
jgi:hypothetical protein